MCAPPTSPRDEAWSTCFCRTPRWEDVLVSRRIPRLRSPLLQICSGEFWPGPCKGKLLWMRVRTSSEIFCWAEACAFLGLPQRYKPYGVRRGGATCLFQLCGKFDVVMNRGRWNSRHACKVYATTALQELAEEQRSPVTIQRCNEMGKKLLSLTQG